MSTHHEDTHHFHSPTTTDHLAGNSPSGFTTIHLPHPQSPKSPTIKTTTSPESRIAAALGHAIFTIPSTSFQDAATTTTTVENNHHHSPLRRTISDTSSSLTQDLSTLINATTTTTTTTPPRIPEPERRISPLRRTNSDTSSSFNQDLSTLTTTTTTTTTTPPPTAPEPPKRNTPLRRSLSDPFSEYQPPQKTKTPSSRISPSPVPRTTPPPESSIRKQSPVTEKQRLRKMEDTLKEIGRSCWDAVSQPQEHVEDEIPGDQEKAEQEECIGVERLSDGGLRIRLDCSCGKGFELLLKDSDYCFYRLI